MIYLHESLSISPDKREIISFIGAGGKTTAMFKLAGELKVLGKRVLVTTTTSIYYPKDSIIDNIILGPSIKQISSKGQAEVIVWGTKVNDEGKLKGVSKEDVDEQFNLGKFDYILNEADGSRRKPLKAPAVYEPVVPNSTTKIVGIIGIDALEKPVCEVVHRPELYCHITGLNENDLVDMNSICKILFSEEGLFRNTCEVVEKILFINKVDNDKKRVQSEMLRKLIMTDKNKRENLPKKVFLTSLLKDGIIS